MEYKTKNLKANKIILPKTVVRVYNSDKSIVNGLSFGEIALLRSTIKALMNKDDNEVNKMLLDNTTEVLLDKLIKEGCLRWKGVITKDNYLIKVSEKCMHLINSLEYSYLIDANEVYEVINISLADLAKRFIDYEFEFGEW